MKLAPIILYHEKEKRLPMSLVVVITKKATSKAKVVRLKIIHRVKAALGLIVARGADVVDGKIVVDDKKALEKMDEWVLRGVCRRFY